MRRRFLLVLLALILLAGAAFWWWSRPLPILTVVTWPGTYGRAQASAQILPYGVSHRVDARIQQWAENGTLAELQGAIAAHRAGDVVDLELPVAIAACKAGLLEPIDAASLPPGDDGAPAAADFYKGMIGRCFVASAIYAQMISCRPCAAAGVKDVTGLFALVVKGGKIALQRGARINLEMALLADGVKPDDLYRTLATSEGVARAFARLDTVKPHIVWASSAQAARQVSDGTVDAATALTADVQTAPAASLFPVQFYEADVLALPKGGAAQERARDYIAYATGSTPLAGMVKFAPYMPPRRSALKAVEALPASATRDFVLSQRGMLDGSVAVDDAFWAEHGPALEARFRAWADTP